MEFKSTQRFIRMSPRKVRLVVPLVKKLTPQDAIDVLPHTRKRAAVVLSKVIKTAIANAQQKGVNIQDLTIKEIQVGDGPRLKRWRPGARGRVKPYVKRMCQIRVVLEENKEKKKEKVEKEKNTTKKVVKKESKPKKAKRKENK